MWPSPNRRGGPRDPRRRAHPDLQHPHRPRRGRPRRRPRRRGRRDRRLPRPERGRQDHHAADAHHAARPTAGTATVAGCDLRTRPGRGAPPASATSRRAAVSFPDARAGEELVDQARLYGIRRRAAAARGRGTVRPARPGRAVGTHLRVAVRRPAAPPRHRAWDWSTPAAGLPRRADHRPRPAVPRQPVGARPRRCATGGTTVFLTTHYLDEADALCDRILVIDHGLIVAEGTPEQLKRQVSGDAVVLSLADPRRAADVTGVVAALPGAGTPSAPGQPGRGAGAARRRRCSPACCATWTRWASIWRPSRSAGPPSTTSSSPSPVAPCASSRPPREPSSRTSPRPPDRPDDSSRHGLPA